MIDFFGRHATEKWMESSRRQRRMLNAFIVYAQKHPCDHNGDCVKEWAETCKGDDSHG